MGKEKMKSAVWIGKGEVKIEEWPVPQPGDDEVLIDVSHTGICASDMHIIGDGLPLTVAAPPRIIGHEFSGVVEAFGSKVKGYKKGDRVVAHPVGPCGECFFCREGEENLCMGPFFGHSESPTGFFCRICRSEEQAGLSSSRGDPLAGSSLGGTGGHCDPCC